MNMTVVYVKGKIRYCRHLHPDPEYNKYSVQMGVEGEDLDNVREWIRLGIRNQLKSDEEGWWVTLSRKTSFEAKGKVIPLAPPRVIDKEGKPITVMVGHGSDGIAKCELRSYPKFNSKGLRWEALRVDNLVEYNVKKDEFDGGESTEELRAQEPLF